nr:MAG TPA: hypothetical protein [Crassvirales sp.]
MLLELMSFMQLLVATNNQSGVIQIAYQLIIGV